MVSRAAVRGGPPLSATRFLSRRFANRCRADTSGPLRKLSNLAVRRASSRSSSGGNNFLRTRLSALSRSLSLSTCLRPYLEGQGHWSDLWISYIATRVMSRGDAISAPAGRADIKGSHRCSLGAVAPFRRNGRLSARLMRAPFWCATFARQMPAPDEAITLQPLRVPWPSRQSTLISPPRRPRNKNRCPQCGSRLSIFCTAVPAIKTACACRCARPASQTRAAARGSDHRDRLPFASAFISADTVDAATGPEIRI
jgi:hypothetical protein